MHAQGMRRAHIQRKVVVRDVAVMAFKVRAKKRILDGTVTVSSCYLSLTLIYCIVIADNPCRVLLFLHRVGIVAQSRYSQKRENIFMIL